MRREPFTVAIPEETLTDLHERLTKVRWPDDFANSQWEYGTNLAYLRELVGGQGVASLLLSQRAPAGEV